MTQFHQVMLNSLGLVFVPAIDRVRLCLQHRLDDIVVFDFRYGHKGSQDRYAHSDPIVKLVSAFIAGFSKQFGRILHCL